MDMILLPDQLLFANVTGWMSQMTILIRQPVSVCGTTTISILLRQQQQQQHLPSLPLQLNHPDLHQKLLQQLIQWSLREGLLPM